MSEGSRAVRVGMGGRCMVTLRALDGFWICFADEGEMEGDIGIQLAVKVKGTGIQQEMA